MYSKYTSVWENIKGSLEEAFVENVDFVKGILKSVEDLVTGVLGLAGVLAVNLAAGVALSIKQTTVVVPDWMQYCIDKAGEYDKTILEVVKDPSLMGEGLAQGISDAYEEKGISYCVGYTAGEIAETVLISKGLDKLKEISKVGKVSEGAEGIGEAGESVDNAVKFALAKGSEKTWQEFLAANPEKSIEEASSSYIKLIDEQSPWPEGFDTAAHTTTLNPGDTFQMALDESQPVTSPGNFATSDNIPNADYVRNNLAVKSDWKTDCSKVVTYRVKEGVEIPVIEGPVGPQIDLNADKYLSGGGSQIQMILDKSINKMDYLEVVSVRSIN